MKSFSNGKLGKYIYIPIFMRRLSFNPGQTSSDKFLCIAITIL